MAPRSPTKAFDPTPALEHHPRNYSPLNDNGIMISVDNHFPHASKEVRFSVPTTNSLPRAHSIATESVPLLPQVSSASQLPQQSFRITNPTPGIDINAYIENCRNLNEQLRIAHESERKTWQIERTALKAKIADLEFKLNRAKGSDRRSSNESSNASQAARSDRRTNFLLSQKATEERLSGSQVSAPPESLSSPVWKGPEQHAPTTRVFQSEDPAGQHASSTNESDSFPLLTKEISPTNLGPVENIPVPIEQVEPTLDGITLKSAGPALTSSFTTKITSPQFGSPALEPARKLQPEPAKMMIDTSTLLAPLDEKLKRHAGHTPMNFDGAQPSNETSDHPTELPTPIAEQPPAPAPTTRPPLRPSEHSDSYFSTTDVNESRREPTIPEESEDADQDENDSQPRPQFEPSDDKPLKGPLMLDPSARTEAADVFLSSVDAKLMAAVKEVSPTRGDSVLLDSGESVQVPATVLKSIEPEMDSKEKRVQDDDMPTLKLKKSMNFGSAYGTSLPGRW